MLIWLYGEMRDALWPEHGLSGSVARCTLMWLSRPPCQVLRRRARFAISAPPVKCFGQKPP
jgi:hypothetical protein